MAHARQVRITAAYGGTGDDLIKGSNGSDSLVGDDGDDTIEAAAIPMTCTTTIPV
jgi:Ca2+-binding RTX toxin-like protein